MKVYLVLVILGQLGVGFFLNGTRKNLQRYVNWQQDVAAEHYTAENKQKANRTDVSASEYNSLRKTDFRLPHLLPYEVNTQKGGRRFPLEKYYIPLLVYKYLAVDTANYYQQAKLYSKLQDEIPEAVPFPCNTTSGRSKERPATVDRVRPGDIDLIVAMGDSLTIGSGLAAAHIFQFSSLDDDITGIIGGKGTWRQFLTLPNILKEFNPNLYGYASNSSGLVTSYRAPVYNFGVPAAVTDDLITMAERFVQKAQNDPKVDFESDWKLLTINIGAVNVCQDICYWKNPYDAVMHERKMLEKGLDYLFENSPRTIVNFVPLTNTKDCLDSQTGVSRFCIILRSGLCPCFYGTVFKRKTEEHYKILQQIILGQRQVIKHPKYRRKKDFAILEQPITEEPTDFKRQTANEVTTDWRSWGPDCAHFSQRGAALLANTLWNSLMLPTAKKPTKVAQRLMDEFICPTEENPYIPID